MNRKGLILVEIIIVVAVVTLDVVIERYTSGEYGFS